MNSSKHLTGLEAKLRKYQYLNIHYSWWEPASAHIGGDWRKNVVDKHLSIIGVYKKYVALPC